MEEKKRTGNLETGPYTVCASGGFGYIYYVSIDMGNVHFGKTTGQIRGAEVQIFPNPIVWGELRKCMETK